MYICYSKYLKCVPSYIHLATYIFSADATENLVLKQALIDVQNEIGSFLATRKRFLYLLPSGKFSALFPKPKKVS
jgi:hypothetical protein